jgi:5-methylcytosine-specific restriction endonuclease McrA
MQRVFVLDKNQKPLMPCHPARARELLNKKQASVFRRFPFTIILKNRELGCVENDLQNCELKIDPGSKTTGLCIVGHFKKGMRVLFAANLHHRGDAIKKLLEKRRIIRRSRRNRQTRYRQARFDNRKKAKGTLAPSLMSRVNNCKNWALKLSRFCWIKNVSVETVRFDLQKMVNPEIQGVEYQQGTLLGYEIREYLLEKFNRTCVYCEKQNVPLEIEHVVLKSRGGSNRISNITLSCRDCNIKKGNKTLEEFLTLKPKKNADLLLARIQKQLKSPLRDAAAVNSTRYAIGNVLKEIFSQVTFSSGGRTKKNRITQGYQKDHWVDAACVGESGEKIKIDNRFVPLIITAESRGSRQMCRVNKFGFPRTSAKSTKRIFGFQTGDLVKSHVTKGSKQGTYSGRLAVRTSGFFNIKTKNNIIQGIQHSFCQLIQRVDGYSYSFGDAFMVLPILPYRSSPEGISIPLCPKGQSILEII